MKPARPFLRPLALIGGAFSAGLLAASFLSFEQLLWFCGAMGILCAVGGALTFFRKEFSRRAAVLLLSIGAAAGFSLLGRSAYLSTARFAGQEAEFSGMIQAVSGGDAASYLLKTESGDLSVGTKVLLYSRNAPEFSEGERVTVKLTLNEDPPTRSQMGKGADLTGFLSPGSMQLLSEASGPIRWRTALKEALRQRLYLPLSRDAAAFYEAVLLGDGDALSDGLRESFSAAGVSHVLCISGLHISLLAAAIQWLFRRLFGWGKTSYLLTIGVTGLFVFFTGGALSSLRAWIMAAFALSADAFYRDYSPENALGGAVTLLCLLDQRAVFQAGFWMSVLATMALFTLSPAMNEGLLRRLPEKVRKLPPVRGGLRILCSSLAVELCCLPVFFFRNGSVPLLSPFVNLLILPLFPLLMAGGGICLLGGWTAPFGKLLSRILSLFFSLLKVLPGAAVPLGLPGFWICLGTAAVLVGVSRLGRPKRTGLALLLSVILFLAGGISGFVGGWGCLMVAEISAGKGGSLVLTSGGRAVVLGCGGSNSIGRKTGAYLRSIGASRIELLIVPEENRRLMSGVSDLARRVPVEQLSSDSESNWYQTASENPGVRKLLPLTSEKGVLLGRFPFRIARVEGFTRIGVLANGKRLLFLSRKDPLAESLSKEADCTVFYDEISQKDGISSGEYAIIRKDPAWTDGFSEIGENYMPQWAWKALPDGKISG